MLGLSTAVGLALAVFVLAAPSEADSCARLLALVERAGEATGPEQAALCRERLAERRRRLGPWGWARSAWCLRGAASIDDAGAC